MRYLIASMVNFIGKGLDEKNSELAPKIVVSVVTVAVSLLVNAYLPGLGEKAPEEIRIPTI